MGILLQDSSWTVPTHLPSSSICFERRLSGKGLHECSPHAHDTEDRAYSWRSAINAKNFPHKSYFRLANFLSTDRV